MRTFTFLIFVQLLLSFQLLAQTDNNSRKGQFYLKHHLIFLKESPKVFPDNIVFLDHCYCSFNPDVYLGSIVRRGELIEIEKIDGQTKWAKVTFVVRTKSYEILLKNGSKKDLEKSFNLIFSKSEVSDLDLKAVKTRKQLIKYYGYPISACKEGDTEKWFYISEFSGDAFGYDGSCVVLRDNKIVSISGYI
jgi:hypothetical protein